MSASAPQVRTGPAGAGRQPVLRSTLSREQAEDTAGLLRVVSDSTRLQADLQRAGIHPWAWVVNNALTVTPTTNPLLRTRAALERPLIDQAAQYAERVAVVGTRATEPVGRDELLALTSTPAMA